MDVSLPDLTQVSPSFAKSRLTKPHSFPNLFEDVGFFDSFRPTYQWGDTKKQKKKSKAKAIAAAAGDTAAATPAATEKEAVPVQATQATPTANGTAVTSSAQAAAPTATRRQATVEEDDED